MAALLYESFLAGSPPDEDEATTLSERVGEFLLGSAKFAFDKSYVQTLGRIHEGLTFDQPEMITEALARIPAGFVPFSGALDTAARASSPPLPEVHGVADAFRQGLPGLRGEMEQRLSRFGEPVVPQGGSARAFLPVVPTKVETDPVEELLRRADVPVGFVTTVPTWLAKRNLPPAEQRAAMHRLQEVYGQELRQRLEALAAAPPASQRALALQVKRAKEVASRRARWLLMKEMAGERR
jgi:hypothetical protein